MPGKFSPIWSVVLSGYELGPSRLYLHWMGKAPMRQPPRTPLMQGQARLESKRSPVRYLPTGLVWQRMAPSVKTPPETPGQRREAPIDANPCPGNEKGPLSLPDNGPLRVEDSGLEPLTFWLPARRSPN